MAKKLKTIVRLQIQAGEAWELEVEDETAGAVVTLVLEELLRRREHLCLVAMSLEEPGQAAAHGGVVVHDEDGGRRL